MRITRVLIENYRSIRHLEIEPTSLCALVGPNNAGKSNVLSAIELVLGPRFPVDSSLTEADFYGYDESLLPHIVIDLAYQDEGGYDAEMQFEFGDDAGQLRLRYSGEGEHRRWANRHIRDRFPFIRLGIERAVRQQQPTNRWTLLGRLLLQINRELQADPVRMTRFEETMTELRDEVLASAPGFAELREILRTESARQIQRTIDDVDVDFALNDPWNFYRTLQLVVTEDGIRLRAEQMGMGLQSSLAIALLRAYARVAGGDNAVIAIEEPELFLHPIAARQFYSLMRELTESAANPIQILYTTHSGLMVDVERFDDVVLVRRRPGEGSTGTQSTLRSIVEDLRNAGIQDATEASVRARIRATFDRSRTDGFFSSAVILVEGASEELSLPVYAGQLGIDLDRMNIAVVAAGSKTAMPLLMRVFGEFGIPVFPIFDGDGHLAETKAKPDINVLIQEIVGHQPAERRPNTTVTERLAVWAEDYERMLRESVDDYGALEDAAGTELGGAGKGVRARHCALALTARGEVPLPVEQAIRNAVGLVT